MLEWLQDLVGRKRPTRTLAAWPGPTTFSVVTETPGCWQCDDPRLERVGNATAATRDFVLFQARGVVPTPDALVHLADAIERRNDADFLFGDETEGADGHWHKPGWSPALLLAQPYVTGLFAVRRTLLADLGGGRDAHGAAGRYELALRATAAARAVVHVPHVLGQRTTAEAGDAALPALAAAAARRMGLTAVVTAGAVRGVHRVSVMPRQRQPITVIVPTRDRIELMRTCIDSVLANLGPHDVRVLVVDNGSVEPATMAQFASWQANPRLRFLRDESPFDYAALMNKAVAAAATPWVLLLNNDTQVLSPDWLDQLTGWLDLPDVGAVGAKLYYGNDTIQHAGILIGVGGIASYGHKKFPRAAAGYHGLLHSVRDTSAVTGACLLMRRDLYLAVGGMDPALAIAYNDVDLCLRLRARGHRVLWTPHAELYHFEGKSRPSDKGKPARFERETALVRERWADVIAADPFYNPNLTPAHLDYRRREGAASR